MIGALGQGRRLLLEAKTYSRILPSQSHPKKGPSYTHHLFWRMLQGEANCQQLLQQGDSIYIPVSTELTMPL